MRKKQYDDDLLVELLARSGQTYVQIARRVGVSKALVGDIAWGRARKDLHARILLAREALAPHERREHRPVSDGTTRVRVRSEYDDDLLVELITDPGATTSHIARRVGISNAMVAKIVRRQTRGDLQGAIDEALRAKLRRARRARAGGGGHTGARHAALVRRGYDDDLLVELIARGDLSTAEIARRVGLGKSGVWRIITGKARPDLQARISEAVSDHGRCLHRIAARFLEGLLSRHIKQGMTGIDEAARKCREFVIKLIWKDDDQADSTDPETYPLPVVGLTSEDYQAIAILKGGPTNDEPDRQWRAVASEESEEGEENEE